MVGLVVVGDPKKNLDAISGSLGGNAHLSAKAKAKVAMLLEQVKAGK